ncbi:MAG: Crp/Fnr family transcriptional regulator [Anaerolineae bacterium]|nr:Crp/Fnr family transcriptional regulator [Thermoflexales bacterium]MDW8396074.1 Crp/Fnr family transcriptional regulator [Anaerolineae bacterium]
MSQPQLDISQTDLFTGLTSRSLQDVLAAARPVQTFPKAHYLFWQGEPAHICYVLVSGQAYLIQLDASGHEVVLGVVGSRQAIGITALLEDGIYSTSALTAEETTVLSWEGSVLRMLAKRYPTLLNNALRIAMERYVDLQQAYRQLAFKPVERRLANVLLKLAQSRPSERGAELVIREPRERLAALAVTTIYTVSRLLTDWERRGLVSLGRGVVVVRDLAQVSEIADHDNPPGWSVTQDT